MRTVGTAQNSACVIVKYMYMLINITNFSLVRYAGDMAMPIIEYAKIRPLRLSKGLGQEAMAMELGVSRPTYVLIESGKKEPTLSQIYVMARLLGVKPSVLCQSLKDV